MSLSLLGTRRPDLQHGLDGAIMQSILGTLLTAGCAAASTKRDHERELGGGCHAEDTGAVE